MSGRAPRSIDSGRLVLAAGVARLRSRRATADVASRLERAGFSVRVVDLAGVVDKAALLAAVARDLGFPAWVGNNWDALDDALRDLSWWPPGERGRGLIVARSGRAGALAGADWSIFCGVLRTATERWATTASPLGVLVRGRALA